MSNSTLVAVRVPSEILGLLDSKVSERLATDRKANRSQLILDALEAYLSQTALNIVLPGQTALDVVSTQEQIESAIAPIAAQMEELKASLGKFKPKLKGFAPDR